MGSWPWALYFSKALFGFLDLDIRRGLCTEGNLRLKIDWASLMLGRKFYYRFSLFYFVYEGDFQVQAGGLIFGGAIWRRFFALGAWGAYIWRGLYMEGLILRNYGSLKCHPSLRPIPQTGGGRQGEGESCRLLGVVRRDRWHFRLGRILAELHAN